MPTSITGRFKDAVWSVRQQFRLGQDLDKIVHYLAFEQDLDENALNDLFIDHPTRIPYDFNAALIARIQQITRQYWAYQQNRKGYHRILRSVLFLEDICRVGFRGCRLTPDEFVGHILELNYVPPKKKKKVKK